MTEKEKIEIEALENAFEEELQSDSGVYAMARAVSYSAHDTTEPSDDDDWDDDENGEHPDTGNGDTESGANTTPDLKNLLQCVLRYVIMFSDTREFI